MIVESHPTGGIFFKLEKQDFKVYWKAFLREIKKRCKTLSYEPPERPIGEFWFFVGADSIQQFEKAKKDLIDWPFKQVQADMYERNIRKK